MSDTLQLANDLIGRASVTPEDAGCQELMRGRLAAIGFECQDLPFGDVSNFWARRGNRAPLLVFAGHTDVVPVGDAADWTHDPFGAEVVDGWMYGRGAVDMKSGVAAFAAAAVPLLRLIALPGLLDLLERNRRLLRFGLRALDLAPGARVLIPAFTFAAVPSAVVHADCTPVLVEIGENYRIDMDDFAAKLPGADAVLISHMRGHTSDMDRIMELRAELSSCT